MYPLVDMVSGSNWNGLKILYLIYLLCLIELTLYFTMTELFNVDLKLVIISMSVLIEENVHQETY